MKQRERIKLRDRYTCQQCGLISSDLEVDHIINLSAGGDESDANQRALCRDCHAAKTARESNPTGG